MSQPYDCIAKVASPSDVDDIVEFYKNHRNHVVYLRHRDDIQKSVDNELFMIVRNNEGEIIAASGIYILANGKPIDSIKGTGGNEWGVVAELGSVLRWEEGLPEGKRYPGVWHPFLFSVPLILLAQKVGVKPNELPIDYIVCDVQTTEISNIARLTGQVALTPHRWTIVNPSQGLVSAFNATTDDVNAKNDKHFFKASVDNLPLIAKYLQKCITNGLTNQANNKLNIDMSDLLDRWTNAFQDGQRLTFLDRITANASAIKNHAKIGWKEFGRIFESVATREATPLSKANGGYHRTAEGITTPLKQRTLRGAMSTFRPALANQAPAAPAAKAG